jgi:H+/gluconate symporter-like permease
MVLSTLPTPVEKVDAVQEEQSVARPQPPQSGNANPLAALWGLGAALLVAVLVAVMMVLRARKAS